MALYQLKNLFTVANCKQSVAINKRRSQIMKERRPTYAVGFLAGLGHFRWQLKLRRENGAGVRGRNNNRFPGTNKEFQGFVTVPGPGCPNPADSSQFGLNTM